jgi:hypothetical protein
MGHSVAVSALQMANAMAAIANGGDLLQPYLILGQVDENGRVTDQTQPEVIRRVMKPVTADSLIAFLRGVVENGTGEPVNSRFVSIAGKTGTAELPDLENGGYHKNRFLASFCGFFPTSAPVVAGIVALTDPHPITYGGHTAGRAFRQIAERYAVSNPDLFAVTDRICVERRRELDMTVEVPNFIGRDVLQAMMLAEERGVTVRCDTEEGAVVWQYPAPDRLVINDDPVLLVTRGTGDDGLTMIDLKGLTVRKAAAFLSYAGIKYEIEGSGRVASQSVRPGTPLSAELKCRLRCRTSG